MEERDYGKVTNIRQTFIVELNKRSKKIVFWSLYIFLWTGIWIFLFVQGIVEFNRGSFMISYLPWVGLFLWISTLYKDIRETFWVQLADKYKCKYDLRKSFREEKALVFQVGHSKHLLNGISGIFNNHPFHIYEYQYSIGHGKGRQDFVLTVFEATFKGSFPHLYLDYKNNSYSTKSGINSSLLAQLSLPKEFENKFKFYSPKEYEIETLEIFTPDVFLHLINLGWNYDMEFINGELVMYRKVRLNSTAELEEELIKVEKIFEVLAPKLNHLKLEHIGNIPSLLSK